jgi:hypothetical protein
LYCTPADGVATAGSGFTVKVTSNSGEDDVGALQAPHEAAASTDERTVAALLTGALLGVRKWCPPRT